MALPPDVQQTEIKNGHNIHRRLLDKLNRLTPPPTKECTILHKYCAQLDILRKNPEANIELPTESAIISFLEAIRRQGSKEEDIGEIWPGLPQAITVAYIDGGKGEEFETSENIWRLNEKLRKQSSEARYNRLGGYKDNCEKISPGFCSGFDKRNKTLRLKYDKLKDGQNGTPRQCFVNAVMNRRKMFPNDMIFLPSKTFKPNGQSKPPRFLCGCRFHVGVDLVGEMQHSLHRLFGDESCAEVAAMLRWQSIRLIEAGNT